VFFFEELNTSYIAFSSSFSAPHQDRGWAWFISPVPATYATVELPAEAFGEFQGGPRAGQKRCWHRRRRKPQRVMTQGGHAHTTAALRQGDSGAMGHGAATRAPTHQRLGERGAAGQGAAARIPDHQRLGARVPPRRRRHISPPDSEGWREMLPQQADTPVTAHVTKSRLPRQRGIPEPLRGRCLNCLSFTHRIATCRDNVFVAEDSGTWPGTASALAHLRILPSVAPSGRAGLRASPARCRARRRAAQL
jgi:hypothetical protein